MPRIPDDDLDGLRRNTDLAALVRAHGVELKKHGSRDLAGRCPFHAEKTASFVVTPSKNLFHCLGCGAAGGPIDFVMKAEGLTFRAAVDKLLASGSVVRRGAARSAATPETAAAKKETGRVGNAGAPSDAAASAGAGPAALPEERAQVLLERVVTIYAQAFAETNAGRDYLAARGLADLGLLTRQRAGFADGRLAKLLPTTGNVRAELRALGVLLDGDAERFAGCVVFPVCDDAGRIVTLYGRHTATAAGSEGKRHVYLPDRPKTLWNASVLKSSPHVVAVEAILDALSVETAGVGNVVALQGTNGLGDADLATLRAQGAQRVTLFLDGDAAGRAGTERLKEKLHGENIAVEAVALPEGEDPNSFLVKHGAAALAALLAPRAASSPPSPALSSASGAAAPTPGGLALTFGLRRYDVRGLEKTARTLKATVRVERAGKLHVDTLDLYSARARRQLALDLVRILEEAADTIDADLIKLLTACETHADRAADGSAPDAGTVAVALTEADRRDGEAFGRAPKLIDAILADYALLGLVGERANSLLGYLTMTSRKLPRPIAVLNLASSGAGKTTQQDTTLRLCPPEDLIKLTSLSGKALFYKERSSLKNKVLALEEGDGVQDAMYALRNLISAGELITESTIKDPATGKLVTMTNKIEGPTAVFLTTTNPEIDPETKSRFFVTSVDESRAQTQAILASQRHRQTLAGLTAEAATAALVKKHHAFQRLLRPLRVVNNYADQLSYGDDRLPGRRDQPKYLRLIEAIAFLRQMQKPQKTLSTGQPYVEVDRDDIRLANDLANELLGHSLDELSRPGFELLQLLDKMRAEWVKTVVTKPKQARALDNFSFSRRQVREFAGWAHARVYRYLRELLELEYVVLEGGRNGVLHRYALAWDGAGRDGKKFLLGLKSPEELRSVA
jgi:DNA primase